MKKIEKFDEQGNLIYTEDESGYWAKWKYNAQGNETYYENSNGYWGKWKYNARGNKIYWEDSNGHWAKCDDRGNVIGSGILKKEEK